MLCSPAAIVAILTSNSLSKAQANRINWPI
jgi:hypothetical protein